MRLPIAGHPHLTYCTNIHPGETWPEIFQNLEQHVLKIKRKVAPDCAYGIGLRLSGQAAHTLSSQKEIDTFKRFLQKHNLYVFTINAFPHGTFHGNRVKERVYRPDWLEEERLKYADQCAGILAALLAEHPSIDGSISTVPGAFKGRALSFDHTSRIASQLLRHAATLYKLQETTGRTITCALEPEPCCLLETMTEAASFFTTHIFNGEAIATFSRLTGLAPAQAEDALRRHLGVCLDTCHAAVEYENPDDLLSTLRDAGIRILKIQLSTGLRIFPLDRNACRELQPFVESTYLHQVIERTGNMLTRYVDLPHALHAIDANDETPIHDREWRIHFHVPIFLSRLGPFENTQPFLTRLLQLQLEQIPTTHLEIETYTWNVLPDEFRQVSVADAIAREMEWVIEVLT